MQYEYHQESIEQSNLLIRLNELGKDRWELCSAKEFDDGDDWLLDEEIQITSTGVWQSKPMQCCIFKREIQ